MTIPDSINGAFELFGGFFILMNIRQLLRDKQVKGIHWGSSIFFTSWGLWNVWYYPHLGQWASFAGGVVICILNVVWLCLRVRYSQRLCGGCAANNVDCVGWCKRPRPRRRWVFFDD